MRYLLISIVAVLVYTPAIYAQPIYWTLEDCISYAYKHNISLKSAELDIKDKTVIVSEQKWNFLPSIYSSHSASISNGRVLDQTTYDYVENKVVGSSSSSVSANINIFSGFRNYHNLKRAKLDLCLTLLSAEQIKDDLRLNITAIFLEILYAKENIKITEQIVNEIRIQAEKISIKIENGKATIADLLQIKAQLSEAENNVIIAKRDYDLSRLNICQLLEIDDYTTFQVADVQHYDYWAQTNIVPEIYMSSTIESIPKIQVAEKNITLAKYDLKIAKASYYPTISLSLGYGSNFSNARYKMFQNNDGSYRQQLYPFVEQYKDNASSYISLSLNIPIFNKLMVQKDVQRKKIAVQRAEYALSQVKKQVKKEVREAEIEAKTAYAKFNSASQAVESANEAVRQVTMKYELGIASITDYNAVITSQYKALSNLSQAKYEYIFKCKMLEYYAQ